MRITRAAKVAAFPLIVLALVALVACQGGSAPRAKGDRGPRLDPGPGTDWTIDHNWTWDRTLGSGCRG